MGAGGKNVKFGIIFTFALQDVLMVDGGHCIGSPADRQLSTH
jgi:hypothetical protein